MGIEIIIESLLDNKNKIVLSVEWHSGEIQTLRDEGRGGGGGGTTESTLHFEMGLIGLENNGVLSFSCCLFFLSCLLCSVG